MSSGSASPHASQPNGLYASSLLHPSTDSIRIVTIEPDLSNEDGLLVCHLQTTTFAQRPRYETLSYQWGDESSRNDILVDGVRFSVTSNLWAALHYFREHQRGVAIWIDAISINQSDIPERSRQLRIMPHIYARAASTLVWLGGRYIDVPLDLSDRYGDGAERNAEIKNIVMADGYWNRVWILQEIVKARNIRLCFGRTPVEWDDFIAWICKHDDVTDQDDLGPLRLHHLRQNRHGGSCSLRQLLINHASALCKDPRDKIYGLVGLSTDGRGFPMDYSKTLLQVWSDTMHFMSRHELLSRDCHERVQFCRIVRGLLGGQQLGSVSGVVQLHNHPDAESLLDKHDKSNTDDMALSAITFDSIVYGVIVSLGPSTTELLSSLQVTDAWEEELQRLYRGNLNQAHHENDNLMRHIFDAADGKLVPLSTFENHRISFHGPEIYGHYWDFIHKPASKAPGLENSWVHPTSARDEPRLAMLKISSGSYDYTPFKLAFVSPDTRQGDLVCRIVGYPMKRVVVRPAEERRSSDVRMPVCSTAIMVKDLLAETCFDENEVTSSHHLDVSIDARTLYALIFGNDEQDDELRMQLAGCAD